MEEVIGENVVDKYVKKSKEKQKKPTHVGGAVPKNEDTQEKFQTLNKVGLAKRDY